MSKKNFFPKTLFLFCTHIYERASQQAESLVFLTVKTKSCLPKNINKSTAQHSLRHCKQFPLNPKVPCAVRFLFCSRHSNRKLFSVIFECKPSTLKCKSLLTIMTTWTQKALFTAHLIRRDSMHKKTGNVIL